MSRTIVQTEQGVRTRERVAATDIEKPRTPDYELTQRAAEGDMKAFEELYQRHNRRVYSLCLRMTGNVVEAEDLSQEVFIQLFRKIGSFRGESAFTTWLHRLTVNQVLMHFRKRGVRLEQTTDFFFSSRRRHTRCSRDWSSDVCSSD